MTEQNETPVSESSADEELDDLFLSPEDSEGEIIAEVDASGETKTVDEVDAVEQESPESESDEPSEAGETVSSAELEEAREQIAELEEERDELKNRMMRVAADLENFRKRAAREREDMRKYGIDKVTMELLPVMDNLERALQSAEASADGSSITDGVRMVQKQFLTALGKHGVKGFESKGEPFDPQRHEAIQQVETDEFETGTIIEQYQKGYFLHDRLIRPAMVSVAKRVQPAAGAPEATDSAKEDSDPDYILEVAEPAEPSEPAGDTAEENGDASETPDLEETTDVGADA